MAGLNAAITPGDALVLAKRIGALAIGGQIVNERDDIITQAGLAALDGQ